MQSNFEAFFKGCVLRPCPFYFSRSIFCLTVFFITTDALRISQLQYKNACFEFVFYRLFIRKDKRLSYIHEAATWRRGESKYSARALALAFSIPKQTVSLA